MYGFLLHVWKPQLATASSYMCFPCNFFAVGKVSLKHTPGANKEKEAGFPTLSSFMQVKKGVVS